MDKSLKQKLVRYGKKIIEKGLAVGPGGNISARKENTVYLSLSGYSFDELTEDDYVGVDLKTGKAIEGTLKPTCEVSMHLGCYLTREDISAIIHTHPPLAIGVISAGAKIKPMFPDFVALVGEVPVIDYVIPAGEKIRKAVTKVIKRYDAVLLKNHGLVVVGSNLKEAFCRSEIIEEAARILIVSRIFGKPRFLKEKEIKGIKNLKAEDYRKMLLKKGQ